MDSDVGDDDVFDDSVDAESEGYSPEVKPKAKAAPKKAAMAKVAKPKKMVQTTLTGAKAKAPASKKRPKPESDDDDDGGGIDASILSNTPPSAKKQKKAPAKKSNGKPPGEIENDVKAANDRTGDYKKLSPHEHILVRPDTYVGSLERTEQKMWVFNKADGHMEYRNIAFVPALYKIFDEILVNAADQRQREASMTFLKVTVDREAGEISVENNGKGIPVEMHKEEQVWVPELIFGHLLAGSNFDDEKKKTTGGRNGYGAKLTNIFSTSFTVECQDSVNGKRYKQTWTDNMFKMGKPSITSKKSADFVRVTFKPDFKKFGMEGIDEDLEALLYRRVYDMAGTVPGVKVHLNGEVLKINWKAYCNLYAKPIAKERGETGIEGGPPSSATVEFDSPNKRWQIGFTVSDGSFQQVSFVNNISTTSGGTHVNHIVDQICDALLKELNKKKKGHSLKPSHFKNHIFVFINCLVDNPAFTSQTKEQLTTKTASFGGKCELSDSFLKKVRSSEVIADIMSFADRKADKLMAKSDGSRRARVSNEKLVDANLAGTKHGYQCTLILTEGDSAKGLAVAGRAVLDPDRIGVFPLRGKLLNVRDSSIDQIMKNKEIENIKKFMGLKHKQHYSDTKGLRYGHLMIMADQDHDGSHIKGLLINFLEVQFPSLLRIPDFFQEFITPVVKVWQGSNPSKPLRLKSFFTIPEYEEWKKDHHNELRRWQYKYYKGLGTSEAEDAQVYFKALDDHLKEFMPMSSTESDLFDLAFSKKKADARKEWLRNFVPGTYLDHSTKSITYTDFVNRELILFSMADNMRSIPSVIDGFKPGQRKVLFSCLKRNLIKDKKVVELAGYVSETAAYHHGEASLQQTIVGLAQNFVGSNNINVLVPSGNFGSRLAGGSDAASARYIFTRLSPFARKIFPALDEPNLDFQFEDGKMIEPKVYAPVIPMVLVNGAEGIGTGYSTSIPNYHPIEIVNNLKRRMGRLDGVHEEQPYIPMKPWFRGWTGDIEQEGPHRYRMNGRAHLDEQNPTEVVVSELPIRMWTDDFKAKLEEIIRGEKTPSFIKDYKEFNDHKTVNFVIQMEEKHMEAALKEGLLEKFKLLKSMATTNLVAFNTQGMIHKYESPEEMLEEFFNYRLNMYTERKAHWLRVYENDLRKLRNMYRFVKEINDRTLVVSKKKKAVLIEELRTAKYDPFPPQAQRKAQSTDEELDAQDRDDQDQEDDDDVGGARDYDYLLSMPIWALTLERLEKLQKQIDAKNTEIRDLTVLSEKDLWIKDLDDFVEAWEQQLALDDERRKSIKRMGRRTSKKLNLGNTKARGRKIKNEEDDFVVGKKKPAKTTKTVTKTTVVKPEVQETKAAQRFAEKFQGAKSKPKPKSIVGGDGAADDFSDDDIAMAAKNAGIKTESDGDGIAASRSHRAAASKPKQYVIDDDDDDDESDSFMELGLPKPAASAPEPAQASESLSAEDTVATKPVAKHAAAPKKPLYVEDDEDEDFGSDLDDEKLGDVGSLVKGISASSKPAGGGGDGGRLSLFAMSRPDSASGDKSSMLAGKARKTSRANQEDVDDLDTTNYEALAASSPRRKSSKAEDLGSFLSDDEDDLPPPTKIGAAKAAKSAPVVPKAKVSTSSAAAAVAPTGGVVKKRGRPAGAKSKTVAAKPKVATAAVVAPPPKTKIKTTGLSPAAKAYAAKKAKARKVVSDDDEEDDGDEDVVMRDVSHKDKGNKQLAHDEDEDDEPLSRTANPRGRPGRAAATKAKPIYLDEDEDEDEDDSYGGGGGKDDDDDEDEFGMDEDSE